MKIMVVAHDDDHGVDHDDDGGAVGFDDEHMDGDGGNGGGQSPDFTKSLRMQYWTFCKACKAFSCLNKYVALAWHKDFFNFLLGVASLFFYWRIIKQLHLDQHIT